MSVASVMLRRLAPAFLALAGPADAHTDRVAMATDRLERDWGVAGGWRGIHAWQRFVIADILLDGLQAGDRASVPRLAAVIANRAGLDGNDDDLWAVLAEVHLHARTGDPELLRTASTAFDAIVARYWDTRCGGGLWWDHARTYKNAITNELLILVAADLYRATAAARYRDWAKRGWRWFAASGMIAADGLVNDGLDSACRNNGAPTYTYNQGVILGGLLALHRIEGDPTLLARASKIAIAAVMRLTDRRDILREPARRLEVDGPIFKGVFAMHLGRLVAALPPGADRDRLSCFLRTNAQAVWRRSGAGSRPIAARWEGADGQTTAAAQASGVALFVAARRAHSHLSSSR